VFTKKDRQNLFLTALRVQKFIIKNCVLILNYQNCLKFLILEKCSKHPNFKIVTTTVEYL